MGGFVKQIHFFSSAIFLILVVLSPTFKQVFQMMAHFTMRENCPNAEFFLDRIFRIQEKQA